MANPLGLQLTSRLDATLLDGLAKNLHAQVDAAVRKAAADVEAQAKTTVPVDTGTLKNSLQTTYPDDLTAVVGTAVEYGPYVELGTRFMAARPFLYPAAEKVRPEFEAAVKRVLKEA